MCVDNTPVYVKLLKLIIPLLITSVLYLVGTSKNKNFKKYLIIFIILNIIIFVVWYMYIFLARGC